MEENGGRTMDVGEGRTSNSTVAVERTRAVVEGVKTRDAAAGRARAKRAAVRSEATSRRFLVMMLCSIR